MIPTENQALYYLKTFCFEVHHYVPGSWWYVETVVKTWIILVLMLLNLWDVKTSEYFLLNGEIHNLIIYIP